MTRSPFCGISRWPTAGRDRTMRQLVIDAVGVTVARILSVALTTAVVILVARWMGVDL